MKVRIGILCLATLAGAAYGQGTIIFNAADGTLAIDGSSVVFGDSLTPPGFVPVNSTFRIEGGSFILIGTRPSGSGSGGSSYFTGTGSTTPEMGESPNEIRARAFSSGGYFTSSGEVVDAGLALRLGDGVNPLAAAGGAGLQAVPEASSAPLFVLGAAVLFAGRAFRRKTAGD